MQILSKKSKENVFEKALSLIQDKEKRNWVKKVLTTFPEYFWTQAASTTGKYHPNCVNVKSGLLIHTKRVTWFALIFIRAFGLESLDQDDIIAACILHDGWKGGKGCGERTTSYQNYLDHPILVEKFYRQSFPEEKLENWQQRIFDLIKYHMGPWTPDLVKKPLEKYSILELSIYLADYFASRKELRTKVDSFGDLKLEYEDV